jgi:hypothetical protein
MDEAIQLLIAYQKRLEKKEHQGLHILVVERCIGLLKRAAKK